MMRNRQIPSFLENRTGMEWIHKSEHILKNRFAFCMFLLLPLSYFPALTFPSLFEQCLEKAKNLVVALSPEWEREEYCTLETLQGKREMGIEYFINYTY